jgi:phosphatidylserine/phosphatidylglycerophosphate/cardiolipin synthase-like enzyme
LGKNSKRRKRPSAVGGIGSRSDGWRAWKKTLLAGGVPVYYDSLTTQTHAKMVLVDDMTIVGSTNWTHNALVDGNEASVLVKSKEVSEIYRKYFDTLKGEGIRVTPDTDLYTMKKEMEKKDKEQSTLGKKPAERPVESSSF